MRPGLGPVPAGIPSRHLHPLLSKGACRHSGRKGLGNAAQLKMFEHMIVTLLYVIHCYASPGDPEGSIWLVPGTIADFKEGGALENLHLTEYVEKRGVLLKRVMSSYEENIALAEVRKKFEAAGFEVINEALPDD